MSDDTVLEIDFRGTTYRWTGWWATGMAVALIYLVCLVVLLAALFLKFLWVSIF